MVSSMIELDGKNPQEIFEMLNNSDYAGKELDLLVDSCKMAIMCDMCIALERMESRLHKIELVLDEMRRGC